MSKRIAFKVNGQVQGVSFRYDATKSAKSLGITGFVQNDPAGSVSGEAQGSDENLKQFIQHINVGPSVAQVEKVEQHNIDTKENESGFRVR